MYALIENNLAYFGDGKAAELKTKLAELEATQKYQNNTDISNDCLKAKNLLETYVSNPCEALPEAAENEGDFATQIRGILAREEVA